MLYNLIIHNASITTIVIFMLGFIFSIGFHEFSHAKSAQMMGDLTPVYQGRVTLNPLAHLDPIGTLLMFFAPFGWGKPVEVNPNSMGNYPERKYFISSIVGPISNLFLAVVILIILAVLHYLVTQNIYSTFTTQAYNILVPPLGLLFSTNIFLALFNLIPIPPLDGSKIWPVILPYDIRVVVEPLMEKYSFVLLLLLVFPLFGGQSIASILVNPIYTFITSFLFNLFG